MRPSRLSRLPKWLSFWLGYRETPPPIQPPYIVWFWSFVGAFTGLSIIQAIFGHVPYFVDKGVPSIGATAVLIYGAIESPLAQPRPVLGGHLISAFIGICITKLFLLLPTHEDFLQWVWLAGSLSCAVSLVVMQMTGTTHPPAGATALIAAVNPDIRRIGWFYLPVVLMVSLIAIIVALFTNNMQRQYPTYWWTPDPPPSSIPSKDRDLEKGAIALPMSPASLSPFDSQMSTPVHSEPPTPTDSTVVSRRASMESFKYRGLGVCHAHLKHELQKHADERSSSVLPPRLPL